MGSNQAMELPDSIFLPNCTAKINKHVTYCVSSDLENPCEIMWTIFTIAPSSRAFYLLVARYKQISSFLTSFQKVRKASWGFFHRRGSFKSTPDYPAINQKPTIRTSCLSWGISVVNVVQLPSHTSFLGDQFGRLSYGQLLTHHYPN